MLKVSLSVFRLLGTHMTGIMCVSVTFPFVRTLSRTLFLRIVQYFVKQSKAGTGDMKTIFGTLATGASLPSSFRLPPMISLPGSFARVR